MDPSSEYHLFLGESLKKAVAIVEVVEERYRETALPIILQHLIEGTVAVNHTNGFSQEEKRNGSNHSDYQTKLSPRLSVNEFFQMASPDTHVGRFVCASYYLLHTGQAEQFTQADILAIYGKLRVKKPQNPADILNQCIKKVYIIDASAINGQRSWVVTPTGEKYVEELLSGSTVNKK